MIFIAVDAEDEPVGQVRFDTSGETEAEIDLSVAPAHRGRGAGSRLIALGTKRARSQEQTDNASVGSSKRTAAVCSWTKSGT